MHCNRFDYLISSINFLTFVDIFTRDNNKKSINKVILIAYSAHENYMQALFFIHLKNKPLFGAAKYYIIILFKR